MTPEENATEALILENVERGFMEFAGIAEDGSFLYRLTDAGKAHVESLLAEGES